MAQHNQAQDTFEQILELGGSIAKQTAQAVNQTLNPLAPLFDKGESSSNNPHQNPGDKGKELLEKSQKKGENNTPLDFDKLDEKYKNQDAEKLALSRRYFQLVTQGTEQAIMENKKKAEEKKRQEEYEEQEKKRREQEEAQNQGPMEVAGKAKGKLGQARPKAHVDPNEAKPGGSKH